MARQQEVRDAILDRVLVPARAAHQLARRDARLEQQAVQVLRRLRGLRRPGAGLVGGSSGGGEQVRRLGRGVGQGGKAELGADVLARAFSFRPAPAQRRFPQRKVRAKRGGRVGGPHP